MKHKEYTCCFTGHRHIPAQQIPAITQQLKKTVNKLINEYGVKFFGVGGALGFDTLAAQTIINIKKDNPDIKLILVLPFKEQASRWKKSDIDICEQIKKQADKIVYTDKHYTSNECYLKRNRHLVDCSSYCICYKTTDKGGTNYTYNYACEKGLSVYNIADLV